MFTILLLLFNVKFTSMVTGQQLITDDVIVQVNQGQLKGVQKTSALTGRSYYSFSGIPYAKPPVGDLRFQPPQEADKWHGVRDAKREGSECIQWNQFAGDGQIAGSEDCLYLNVHTPEPPSEIVPKKPVMVFIHGGAFTYGSASSDLIHRPDFLMNYGIIYVAINYRLNVLGFLNVGTKNCSGNAGLKDQALALKWIKENIRYFGGDPDNITIFGGSAGGASVHLHMLSPASKGLFNKAIAQSGNAFSPWCMTPNPVENGFKLGKLLGFQDNDPEKLVQFLKEKSAEDLIKAMIKMGKNMMKEHPAGVVKILFSPSVELIKENAFLPDSPDKLINLAEPVPFLTGFDDKEGLVIFFILNPNSISTLTFSQVIKDNFDFSENELSDVVEKVEEFYTKTIGVNSGKLEQLSNLFTDIFFVNFYKSFNRTAESSAPVYLYEFSYDGGLNFVKKFIKQMAPQYDLPAGAVHGDDTGYLLYPGHLAITNISDADRNMIDNMCSLWTNFAKTRNPSHGMPNLKWTPYTVKKPCYLKINESLQMIYEKAEEKRFTFWENLLVNAKSHRSNLST